MDQYWESYEAIVAQTVDGEKENSLHNTAVLLGLNRETVMMGFGGNSVKSFSPKGGQCHTDIEGREKLSLLHRRYAHKLPSAF